MESYPVRHLTTNQTFTRPPLLQNPHHCQPFPHPTAPSSPSILAFHRTLPAYNRTPLHALDALASALGLSHIYLKDESTRFTLPAFKILGASWAIHRALCRHLNLPHTTPPRTVQDHLARHDDDDDDRAPAPPRLVTCSEGNWGRACARVARDVGIAATVYVPGFMSAYTRELLRGEGADVRVLEGGSYDDSIAAAREDAAATGALMVMDVSWEGYEEVPKWVTDGYGTMLTETDQQLAEIGDGVKANVFVVAVGVGSWAHAVVAHYKGIDPTNRILAVEPDVAASLKESLHVGALTPIETGDTIMAGMNCGTTSKIAWPILRDGISAAITVTDRESHESVEYLRDQGISAGPCGAATLAALKKYIAVLPKEEREQLVVVLFSTEGWREYEIPA